MGDETDSLKPYNGNLRGNFKSTYFLFTGMVTRTVPTGTETAAYPTASAAAAAKVSISTGSAETLSSASAAKEPTLSSTR